MRSCVPWMSTLFAAPASACGSCRPLVLARIAETTTLPTVLALLLPVAAVGATALAVHLVRRA